jgi:hypothetical protein
MSCKLTIGLTVQPEVLQGLASRPGFRGRGLLARFLYSLPAGLVGRRQAGAPSVPESVANRYTRELQALAASLTRPAGDDPTVLTLDPHADELLLAFERDLEPRLAADRGDLAHLAGWAAKLAGATCRLAALLHLAGHLRDGWAHPIDANTLAGAIRLADYLVEHARAVFDLMGADPRVGEARWLLDWISRTEQVQFSRRDAHQAARGRFRKATDLEPALRLLEEHGYLRRVDPEPSRDPHGRGRPASPRFVVNPLHPSSETTKLLQSPFLWFLRFLRRPTGARGDQAKAHRQADREGPQDRSSRAPRGVTLSNENGRSRFRPCLHPAPAASASHEPSMASQGSSSHPLVWSIRRAERKVRSGLGWRSHGRAPR